MIQSHPGALDAASASQVRSILETATLHDGVSPLSEDFLLALEAPTKEVAHLLVRHQDELVGYAGVDLSRTEAAVAELFITPEHRRQGFGRLVVGQIKKLGDHSETQVWAHGNLEGAQVLARRTNFTATRELGILRLHLADRPAPTPVPSCFQLTTFEAEKHSAAWLRANKRAFAWHPEQGRLTQADLAARIDQDWFRADGFFLAWHGTDLAGYVWVKDSEPDSGSAEIYVVGVDPLFQGIGLGSALVSTAFDYISALGRTGVFLWSDLGNTAAMRTYTKVGFAIHKVDVMYSATNQDHRSTKS